jgi:hypothetical protein
MMFLLLLFLWAVAFYSLLPLLEGMTPVIQGLTWGVILGSFVVILAGSGMAFSRTATPEDFGYAAIPLDTSRVSRVVREMTGDGVLEHIVRGAPETTFREVCEDSWPFETVDRDEQWVIQDSRTNDITDRPLIECTGIAIIMVYGGVPADSKESDHLPEWWDAEH